MGVDIIEVREGYAKASIAINLNHLNLHNTVHGGVIFSLADTVFALASNSYGKVAVALQADIKYFKGVSSGVLIAEAKEDFRSERIGSYTIEIKTEDSLVALFNGIVYIKKSSWKILVNYKIRVKEEKYNVFILIVK